MKDFQNDKKILEDEIFKQMGEIYDPEIMAPITDLGLIYRVELTDEKSVVVDFTLTSPGCPWGPVLDKSIKKTIQRKNKWVENITTNLVFAPPWQIDFAIEELRMAMGYPI